MCFIRERGDFLYRPLKLILQRKAVAVMPHFYSFFIQKSRFMRQVG
jgi:hypothetical protein